MNLFEIIWTEMLRDAMPWASQFFLAVTELGGSNAYLLILVIGFWAVNKRETIVFGLIYLFSGAINFWLKGTFANPRPPVSDWLPGATASGYSLPSGHAQSSTVVYSWLSIKLKKWWTTIAFITVILLVGISRVYLGVHWLGDVLAGWAVGLLIVLALWRFETPISTFLSRYSRDVLYLALLCLGIVATIITELVFTAPGDDFGSTGGLIIGFAIGLWLEGRYVNFATEAQNGQRWRLVLRVIFGIGVVLIFMYGLPLFLPSETLFRLIRYAVVGFVGSFLWPLIFTRIGL
ncbi:MAG: phosphatase PAP2 family protein [Candidatus Thorarchaeota archaeon]|jgi:membrane-associated phospholipid phosphatase